MNQEQKAAIFDAQYQEEDNNQKDNKTEKQEKKPTKGGILLELLIYVVIIVTCIYIVPKYVIQRTIVSGTSMENTLQDADNLLVEKVSYHFTSPKRFDVVVFYPYGKDVNEYYVKRVIGLPGEVIQIVGEDIYINGEILEEDYGKDPITYSGIAQEPLLLGDDEYFLMGDNREVSLDSRYDTVGPVHKNFIAGKAIIRIWPLRSFGTFD